jgi:DNA-directed RNA polymerase subunit RPC12/RpoP
MALIKGCPGAVTFREVRPEDIVCPQCGGEVEIWSDEPVARCRQCGFWVSKERGSSCIDWCAYAKECIGLAKYERLMKTRPPQAETGGTAA